MRGFKLVLMLALLCLSTSVFAQSLRIYPSKELKAQPGETVQLVLSMENDVDILGWQFTLVNQNFFSVCKDEEDEYVRTASRVLPAHVVSAMDTETDPVGVMFTMYHPKNKPMSGNDGEFISIDLKISEDATIGDYNLLLHEIVGSMTGDVAIYQDDLEIPIKIYAEYNISAASADEKMGTVELVGGGEAVESGTAITATATPVDGYEFVNWTDAAGEEVSTENPYEFAAGESIALTAKFKAKNYDVTFDVDGEKTTTSLAFGSVITAPENPAKTGYTFTGWNPAFEEGATVPLNGITYTATWSINQYTITFDTNGGEEMAPIVMEYNAEIGEISNPVRPYYTFLGWTITDEKGKTYDEMPKNMPAANLVLTANWDVDINALKADLMAFLDGVEAPAVSTEAEVYINTDYDYYAVRKAIEDASAALEATDPAEVTAALDQAKVALNPYIEYCKKYGPAVSCEYALSENWGTIILPFDFVVPQGCTIFICEGLKEDNLTLDIRVQYTGSKFTPYIMCGTAGQHMQFIGHIKGTKYSHVQYGIMVGVVDRAYTPLTGDYVMQNQQGVIGFYRVNAQTATPSVYPYHCYLSLPNSKAKVIRWEGITDGIEMVDAEAQDGQAIYNLQGQRLQRQTKGVNIVNGKKVLNK